MHDNRVLPPQTTFIVYVNPAQIIKLLHPASYFLRTEGRISFPGDHRQKLTWRGASFNRLTTALQGAALAHAANQAVGQVTLTPRLKR